MPTKTLIEWMPHVMVPGGDLGGLMRQGKAVFIQGDGREPDGHFRRGDATMQRVGKKAAGALLGGQEWRQFPEAMTR